LIVLLPDSSLHKSLTICQCDLITDDGLENLNDLEQLEELSLGWCRLISDEGLEILSGQPNRAQSLRTLRLARCSITDLGLEHLENLVNLEELDLNGCVGVSSMALGDTLEKLIHLTSLDVSYCPGILRSSWQGKINSLKSLELCYSGVRDSHLARLRNLPMLEELNLDSSIVGDWGISHLVDNNVMPNLTTLDLADTEISDAAMSKIAQFKHMRHLSLFYCNITNRGMPFPAL
jgi:Leucine-rich repeat (LRR) protein